MKRISFLKSSIVLMLLSCFLCSSCASVSPPPGGEVDKIAPSFENSSPTQGAVNVSTKEIVLEFSEDIQVKNLQKSLIVSPNYKGKLKDRIKGNKLVLTLDSTLDANTTYTLNFGNAIQDLTEGNPVDNFTFTFSTGPKLDSLSIKGNVKDLLGQKEIKEAKALLFAESDTAILKGCKPKYISKTDKSGNFSIPNLAVGSYRLAIITDKNDNQKLDKDELGYIQAEAVRLDTANLKLETIYLSRAYEDLKILSEKNKKNYFEIKLNKGFLNAELQSEELLYSRTEDAIQLYRKDPNSKSNHYLLTLKDSLGNQLTKEGDITWSDYNDKNKEKLELSLYSKSIQLQEEAIRIELYSSKPIKSLNINDLPTIFYPKDSSSYKLSEEEIKIENYKILIISKEKPKSDFELRMPKGWAISIENDSIAEKKEFIKTSSTKNLGSISGKIEGAAANYIVELLNDKLQVEMQLKTASQFRFDKVQAGSKRIRVLIDEDGDGNWFPGDPLKARKGEKVLIHNDPIIVKPNWEVSDIVVKTVDK